MAVLCPVTLTYSAVNDGTRVGWGLWGLLDMGRGKISVEADVPLRYRALQSGCYDKDGHCLTGACSDTDESSLACYCGTTFGTKTEEAVDWEKRLDGLK